jgi:hydrogenase nickel incorporation protein HypB
MFWLKHLPGRLAMTLTDTPPVESRNIPRENHDTLARHGCVAIAIAGTPGCGKTSLLEATARRLGGEHRLGVVVAGPAPQRDVTRLAKWVSHVHGAPGPQLTPGALADVLHEMDLGEIDLLLIEEPAAADGRGRVPLGEDAVASVFSVAAGDGRACECPVRVAQANIVLLTKIDLLPHVEFSRDVFRRDLASANPRCPALELSATTGYGMAQWIDWLRAWLFERRLAVQQASGSAAEWFFG